MDWWIRANFTSESLILIFAVSSVIPKNVSDVDGPSTFQLLKEHLAFDKYAWKCPSLMALVRAWRAQH